LLLYGPDGIFIGERVIEFFNNIKINVAFFGILAINFKNGWMVPSSFD
jgi:DeoR/GlpR family transcriptional regulator of sugar metabolism